MDQQQRKGEKGILIEVTGSEALAGAIEDVYRPLTKPEARGRAIRSGLWLVGILGLALIGIALAAIRLYGSGHGGRDLPGAVGHVVMLLALSGIPAWAVGRFLLRRTSGSTRIAWVFPMFLWLTLFTLALFSGL